MLVERAVHPRIIGIGGTRLDYCYDMPDREQQHSFAHIHAAEQAGLSIIARIRDERRMAVEMGGRLIMG